MDWQQQPQSNNPRNSSRNYDLHYQHKSNQNRNQYPPQSKGGFPGRENWFSDERYNPIMAGSIDGTDTEPHDHAITRAVSAKYNPDKDPNIQGDPYKTLFIGRLNFDTTEDTLRTVFSVYGRIANIRLVRDIVTGFSKGYAFVSFERSSDLTQAYIKSNHMVIDGRQVLVDFERERIVTGWVPRRLGGGVGGKKESGQLRFGGRDRPFKKPLTQEIPDFAVKRFDERRDYDRFEGRTYKNKDNPAEDSSQIPKKRSRSRDRESHSRRNGDERKSKYEDRDERKKHRHRSRSRSRERDHHRNRDGERSRHRERERDSSRSHH